MADLPSMVDGLKRCQRKILYSSFKRNFLEDEIVSHFSLYVSEHSACDHDMRTVDRIIVGMAQDFVGSNNINLLQPNGQFGSRFMGGKDAAKPKQLSTQLSPITRFLFPEVDDRLLDYLNEDGQSIEPTWYLPIIPMVLVNGSKGIGKGRSSYVPNYNPRDIVANLRRLLNGEMMEPMHPWYRGFKGTIEKTSTKGAGVTYTVTGIIEEVDEKTLRIKELPIRRWTQDYKIFLESLSEQTETDSFIETDFFIKGYKHRCDDKTVHFEVFLSEENMMLAKQEGLLKKFKLTTTISTSNMHLFDPSGAIKKYDTPEQILVDFFYLRLELYAKRKEVQLNNLEMEISKLENKVSFILGVLRGEIILDRKFLPGKAALLLELQRKGFTPFPNNPKPVENGASDYDYLLSMTIGSLNPKKVQELLAERDKLQREVDELRKETPEFLWEKDLDALEKQLDELDKTDACAEEERKEPQSRAKYEAGTKVVSRRGPKVPRKNDKKANNAKGVAETIGASSNSAMETGNVTKMVKPKGKAGLKRAPVEMLDDEDEEYVPDLKKRKKRLARLNEQLAATNLQSSPAQRLFGELLKTT